MGLKLKHDPRADAIYVKLEDAPWAYTIHLDNRRHIDFSENERPIGIELLHVSKGVKVKDLPEEEELAHCLAGEGFKVLTPR